MNVHLQIGSSQFVLNVQDAAKVMELLNKAQTVESFYLDCKNGYHASSDRYYTRMTISQLDGPVISEAEYQQQRAAYEAKQEAENNNV